MKLKESSKGFQPHAEIADSINERVNAHVVDTRKKTKLISSEVKV